MLYEDALAKPVVVSSGRTLIIDPAEVHGDRFSAWMSPPPGTAPIQTNIAGGSYLVDISGLQRIGRNAAGFAVVRRTGGGSGPVHVVVQTARTAPVEAGRLISIGALLLVLAVLVATVVRPRMGGPCRSVHDIP